MFTLEEINGMRHINADSHPMYLAVKDRMQELITAARELLRLRLDKTIAGNGRFEAFKDRWYSFGLGVGVYDQGNQPLQGKYPNGEVELQLHVIFRTIVNPNNHWTGPKLRVGLWCESNFRAYKLFKDDMDAYTRSINLSSNPFQYQNGFQIRQGSTDKETAEVQHLGYSWPPSAKTRYASGYYYERNLVSNLTLEEIVAWYESYLSKVMNRAGIKLPLLQKQG